MIFSPKQQFHSSNLPILKIVFSPDQNFDGSVKTLFKRELRRKGFLKKTMPELLTFGFESIF